MKTSLPTVWKGAWVLGQMSAGGGDEMIGLVLSKGQALLPGEGVAGRMLCQVTGTQWPGETPPGPRIV